MLSTSILLKNKIKDYSKKQKRKFLINCISMHKNFDDIISIDKKIEHIEHTKNICKICNNVDFEKTNFSEICTVCGYEQPLVQQLKTYEKFEYIKPGSNLITIKKDDGKTIKVDLNKINSWLQDSDPYSKETSIIILALDTIFTSKGVQLPNYVQNTVISLWYNYNTLVDSLKETNIMLYSKYKSIKNKIILALCIYYGCLIHKYNVSLEQLSLILEINVSDINISNNNFKELFKNTEYYSNFNLSTEKDTCKIKLTAKHQIIFNKIIEHLSTIFTELKNKNKISNKNYAAICYYISKNLNKNNLLRITLKELETKCGISTSTISNTVNNIENFYKKNPKLYKELLI